MHGFGHFGAPLGAPEFFYTFHAPLVSVSFIFRAIWSSKLSSEQIKNLVQDFFYFNVGASRRIVFTSSSPAGHGAPKANDGFPRYLGATMSVCRVLHHHLHST